MGTRRRGSWGSWATSCACVMTLMMLLAPNVAHADEEVGWINVCDFSHRLHDDPIVHRGMPGIAHSHDFYGNRRTNALSRARSLAGASTTCEMRGDTAAYWSPTAYLHGQALLPREVRFYYRTNTRPVKAIHAFPYGLRMVAGDHEATRPQKTSVISWNCDHGEDRNHPSKCGRKLQAAHVKFPDCWDGVHLDSHDHMSHMRYSDDGRCPRSHPVPVPRLIMRITWPVHDGRRIRFSSGKWLTYHADFFNTWNRRTLHRLVRHCVHRGIDCGHLDGDPDPVPSTANLVGNDGFERRLRGWSPSARSHLARVAGGMHSRRAVLVTDRSGMPRCGLRDDPGWVRSTRAGRYRASAWVRSADPRVLRMQLRERASDGPIGRETSWVRLTPHWRRVFVDYVPQRPGTSDLALSMWTSRPRDGSACFRADEVAVKRAMVG
jgi:Domain of unknown function (DUF1996)